MHVNPPTPNVVLFGESGSGKSSIVNMIAQSDVAEVSSKVNGVTFKSTRYAIEIDGMGFNIYDTAGLDEADTGTIPKQKAVAQLYRLLKSLDTGVSLLVFCMRAPRIKDTTHKNWRLFHEIICRREVPIVLAITGLEQEDDGMDNWWVRNKGTFQAYGMHPNGIACITATRGKQLKSGRYCLEEEYEESKLKMWQELRTHYLQEPWRVPPVQWLKDIITVSYETRWCGLMDPIEHKAVETVAGLGIGELVERCEMTQEDARVLGEMLSKA
ncbi:hypothetical protein H0H87_012910 [Tephrocybe sp. NHM501043]|nr:hypothetical protein H0H87_012910 [Tephrocybe sp. NHM501043]